MAEVRDATDPIQMIIALQKQVDDLISTVAAGIYSKPTGDWEATFRTTPKAGTLLLQGQTGLLRSDYPALTAWITAQSLFGSVFGVGDGSTTFSLPDLRGRILRGVAAAGETIGQLVGADAVALVTANMASHNHSVSINDHDQHRHDFLTDQQGAHGGHFPAASQLAAAGSALGLAAWNDGGVGSGTHNHGGVTAFVPVSSHVVNQSLVGSGTAHENRQASIAVNFMIWT